MLGGEHTVLRFRKVSKGPCSDLADDGAARLLFGDSGRAASISGLSHPADAQTQALQAAEALRETLRIVRRRHDTALYRFGFASGVAWTLGLVGIIGALFVGWPG